MSVFEGAHDEYPHDHYGVSSLRKEGINQVNKKRLHALRHLSDFSKDLVLSYISVIFNTDGIPVFRSSGFSFWPLINELPYRMR